MQPIQSYQSIETRIQAAIDAIDAISERGDVIPNITAVASEFNVPPQRLRARWLGRQSRSDRPATNRTLTDEQELAVWFAEFKEVCDKYGIQHRDIYNFDETGFRIGIGKDQWIITRDPSRDSYPGSSTNRELITVCETISADGDALPPMVILSAVMHGAKWFTELPDGYLVGVSETGYSNDELSMAWLAHFDRFSSRRQLGAYRLLIMDGCGSHCTKQFIEFCDERNIIPFCLPPHTSHLLQPLDVVVFQPYKHYHAEAVEAATPTGCTNFDKAEFLDAIHEIRCQTLKPSTILSAFRCTGLVPYNPDVVIAKLRDAVSTPSPATPPPLDASPQVPLTIRSLKRQFQSAYNEVSRLEGTTPSLKSRLKTALNGGMAQAYAGAQAVAELESRTAAEKSRRKRSRRANLQRGGVLYAEDARDMVRHRDEDDARKAEEALQRAQAAVKRTAKAERKPFLDAVKKSRKKILESSSSRKKLMKALCLEVRNERRKRAARRKSQAVQA
jgi:hypothetical protein